MNLSLLYIKGEQYLFLFFLFPASQLLNPHLFLQPNRNARAISVLSSKGHFCQIFGSHFNPKVTFYNHQCRNGQSQSQISRHSHLSLYGVKNATLGNCKQLPLQTLNIRAEIMKLVEGILGCNQDDNYKYFV